MYYLEQHAKQKEAPKRAISSCGHVRGDPRGFPTWQDRDVGSSAEGDLEPEVESERECDRGAGGAEDSKVGVSSGCIKNAEAEMDEMGSA